MPLALAESLAWPDEVVQLLDDHHLVVVSAGASSGQAATARFADMLIRRLSQMSETQVVTIDGGNVRDVPSFCRQIERQIVPEPVRRNLPHRKVWWRDVANVIALLRGDDERRRDEETKRRRELSTPSLRLSVSSSLDSSPPPKLRYFIWNDADALLQHDPMLFDRLVNALLGVAAEHEHISPDTLLLQRTVLLGSHPLAHYAEDSHSALNRWLDEEGSPFWEVASVLERPPVLTYRLECALNG